MGKKSNLKSTQNKEPEMSGVPDVPSFSKAMVEISWRIALPFMVISLGGIKLDENHGTEPLYSLLGVFLGIIIVSLIVYKYVDKNFPGTFGGDK